MERTLDRSVAFDRFDPDTERTALHIRRGGYLRVALQFPDGLLSYASRTVEELRARFARDGGARVELFILGDTSFDGFQVDFVAAQHFTADFIVHYGPVDLEAEVPIPVRFVLGDLPLDVDALALEGVAAVRNLDGDDADRRLLIVPSLPYAHASRALAAQLEAKLPSALVCHVNLEVDAAPGTTTPAAPPPRRDRPRSGRARCPRSLENFSAAAWAGARTAQVDLPRT